MICLSAPREVRFDCGHACCCAACAEELLSEQGRPNLGPSCPGLISLTLTLTLAPNPHPNPHPHHEAAALTVALTVTLTVALTVALTVTPTPTLTPTLTLTARRALPELPRPDQRRPQRARRGGLTLTLA